jgi:hypothetical protein
VLAVEQRPCAVRCGLPRRLNHRRCGGGGGGARYAAMIEFFAREGLVTEERGARRLLAAVAPPEAGEAAARMAGVSASSAQQEGSSARRRVRGRVAAGPETVDLTLELPDGIVAEPTADVVCLHSPVVSVRGGEDRSARSVRGGGTGRSGGLEDIDVPLRDRLAARAARMAARPPDIGK